jgi:hypothetical protein
MSGTLGGQGNPLFVKMGDESWAKDSTLNKIFNALPKKWQEASKATVDATNQNTKATEEGNKNQKDFKDKVDQLPGQLKYSIQQVLTTGLSPGGAVFGQLGLASKGLSDVLGKNTNPTLAAFGQGLGMLSSSLKVVEIAFSKFFEADKVFTDLYGSGVRLRGGLQGLITSSSDAGMTIADFSSLMTKNSTTVAAFAGRDVPKLIKSFQDSSRSGGEFIMSLQENAETFLQTAEIYQQAGIAGSMTNDQLVASSRRFIGELTKTSEATGMTRKSLIDFVGSITKSGQAYLLLSTFSKQAGENFVNASTQLAKFGQQGGKLLSDNIQKYFAGGKTFGLLDDSMLKLVATVPGLDRSFENLAEASLKGGDAAEQAQKDFAKTLIGAPVALRQQLLAAMPEIAGTLGDLIQNAERVQKAEKDRADAMKKEAADRKVDIQVIEAEYKQREKDDKARAQSVQEFNKQLNAFNNEIYRVYVGMAETLMPVLKVLTSTLQFVTDSFVTLDKWVSNLFGSKEKDKEGQQTSTGVLGTSLVYGALAYGGLKGVQALRRRRASPKNDPGLGADTMGLGPGLFGRGGTPDKPLFVDIVGGMPGGASAGGGLGPGLGGGAGAGGGAGGGRFGKLLGGAGRLLGKGFLPLSLAMGAFDAFQGFGADPRAGFGSKLLNAGSSALSGATFGLLGSNPAEIAARANAPGMQAANLASAVDFDADGNLRNLANNPRQSAITPTDYQATTIEWQSNVMTTFRAIERLNETMVSILNKIASNTDSLADGLPAQGSGMLPG